MRSPRSLFSLAARKLLSLSAAALFSAGASAQAATVHGTINIIHDTKHARGNADAVVWLTPIGRAVPLTPTPKARLMQKNKRFEPHVLPVVVGTQIAFPNEDPFYHNVFSIYRGKPFDLGLYESGGTRTVRFSNPGVSYIFCNIHPEMSAVVLALPTPYFAKTDNSGAYSISNVPDGRYKLEIWYERASEAELASLAREIDVTPSSGQDTRIPTITIHAADTPKPHLNKYGESYPEQKPQPY